MERDPPIRIAYLMGRYPALSKSFVLREVEALRGLGVEVDTFSIWRSPHDQLLAQADRAETDRTFTFLPLRIGRTLVSHLHALAASPRAYAGLVAHRSCGAS